MGNSTFTPNYFYPVFFRRLPNFKTKDDVIDSTHYTTGRVMYELDMEPYVQIVAALIMSLRGHNGIALFPINHLAQRLGQTVSRNTRWERTLSVRQALIFLLFEKPKHQWGWTFSLSEQSLLEMHDDGYEDPAEWLRTIRGSFSIGVCVDNCTNRDIVTEAGWQYSLVPFKVMELCASSRNHEAMLKAYLLLNNYITANKANDGLSACVTYYGTLSKCCGISVEAVRLATDRLVEGDIFKKNTIPVHKGNLDYFALVFGLSEQEVWDYSQLAAARMRSCYAV